MTGHLPMPDRSWLDGLPLDPDAVPAEPLETLAGFPFLLPTAGAILAGPTGSGKSFLMEAMAYDAAKAGVPVTYLGDEVTYAEFNTRGGMIRDARGDGVGPVPLVEYLDLSETIAMAWERPEDWAAGLASRCTAVIVDPLSTVGALLGLNFEQSAEDFLQFWSRLVQPVLRAGVAVVMLDNVGHSEDARNRPMGTSAKQHKPDLVFAGKLATGGGLLLKCTKVRQSRAPFRRGDQWRFSQGSFLVEPYVETTDVGQASEWQPTGFMERISEKLEAASEAVSKRSIRALVTGDNKWKDIALEMLVRDGFATKDAAGYRSLRPYREGDRAADVSAHPRAAVLPRADGVLPDSQHTPETDRAAVLITKHGAARLGEDYTDDDLDRLEAKLGSAT